MDAATSRPLPEPLLSERSILDIDTTVKPLYGRRKER